MKVEMKVERLGAKQGWKQSLRGRTEGRVSLDLTASFWLLFCLTVGLELNSVLYTNQSIRMMG